MFRSVCAVLALVVGGLVSSVASPAWACGCGAYIPNRSGASVVDERALIAWDGTAEDILMSFDVAGSSDTAAWVMPAPSAAQVSLGDAQVFDQLGRLTSPRVEYRDSWWPTFTWLFPSRTPPDTAGAPSGGAVNVLGSQRIGPFDVTRLAADDPAALAKWLADKDFPHPEGLDQNLAPYLADRWEIVAIQLAPAEDRGSLTGGLQPLRLSFRSDTVVYPMRLSRAATTPQYVDLYVLADHRMDPTTVPVAGQKPTLEFAGHLDSDVAAPLAGYVGEGAFLTRWSDRIYDPASIDGDYVFERAASDTPYQQVIYRTRNHGDVMGLILLAVLASAVVVVVAVLARRARKVSA